MYTYQILISKLQTINPYEDKRCTDFIKCSRFYFAVCNKITFASLQWHETQTSSTRKQNNSITQHLYWERVGEERHYMNLV
jgi:hypothetical protein